MRPYSQEEVAGSYAAEENGRPLLRSGGEGARKGVGGKEGQQKRSRRKDKKQSRESAAVGIASTTDKKDSSLEMGAGKTGTEDEGEAYLASTGTDDKLPCGRVGCKRIAKPGCTFNLCKMCCDRRYRSSVLVVGEEAEQAGANRHEDCPVHKRKNKASSESVGEQCEEDGKQSGDGADAPQSVEEDKAWRVEYTSRCKVLLVGIGADEQLAGYARHRSVFLRGGHEALVEELRTDTARIWQRNLGRDDRCVSDHGREAWFPFLDELVVDFIQRTPLNKVTREF